MGTEGQDAGDTREGLMSPTGNIPVPLLKNLTVRVIPRPTTLAEGETRCIKLIQPRGAWHSLGANSTSGCLGMLWHSLPLPRTLLTPAEGSAAET